ncbi:TatD family hydrolase [Patescibacteria group bacterium]|nr:TatD family hydrolase [Patescibacteria group bacterium]MBU0963909.1 TatD family hydrolase [Patescibacteria group bacterium]
MPLNLIDTHAHLDFEEFSDDRGEVIARSFKVGLAGIINIGCDEDHFKSTLEIASAYDKVYAVIGMHPHEAVTLVQHKDNPEAEIKRVIKRIKSFLSYKQLVGIGEIGLDLYRIARGERIASQMSILDYQKILLKAQLELAIEADLPIVIHCRDAYPELLAILKDYSNKVNLRGVVHSFEGYYDVAEQFIDIGFKLSFNGMITYERSRDSIMAIKEIPLEHMMIESDCPYLSPVPLRGQRNEPACVEYVAKRIAEIKGVPVDSVAAQTTQNAISFFKLDKN